MTEQEAIQGIKNEMECVLSEHSTSYFDECLEVAYASIEKQIAKKATFSNDDGWGVYICPSCGKAVGEHQNYCWNCGQRFYVD